MNVKQLIEQLLKYDQEADVIVGGNAVLGAEELPGHYDGCFQRIIKNEKKTPFYSVVGLEFTSSGRKVVLHQFKLEHLIWDCITEEHVNNLIFKLDNLSDYERIRIQNKIDLEKKEFIAYLKENT